MQEIKKWKYQDIEKTIYVCSSVGKLLKAEPKSQNLNLSGDRDQALLFCKSPPRCQYVPEVETPWILKSSITKTKVVFVNPMLKFSTIDSFNGCPLEGEGKWHGHIANVMSSKAGLFKRGDSGGGCQQAKRDHATSSPEDEKIENQTVSIEGCCQEIVTLPPREGPSFQWEKESKGNVQKVFKVRRILLKKFVSTTRQVEASRNWELWEIREFVSDKGIYRPHGMRWSWISLINKICENMICHGIYRKHPRWKFKRIHL